jgi:hypothetical protein
MRCGLSDATLLPEDLATIMPKARTDNSLRLVTGGPKAVSGDKRSVPTDADDIALFTFTLEDPKKVPVGRAITATVTDPGGNTSEFSVPNKVVSQ